MKRMVAALILLTCSPAHPSHPAQPTTPTTRRVLGFGAPIPCLDVTLSGFEGLEGKVVVITDPSGVPQDCVVRSGQCHNCFYNITKAEGSLLITLKGSNADPVVFKWKNVETNP